MRKTLYRKYRPTKLADVVGQEHITNVLAESIKTGKFSHAYLFTGPRGTGKTSVARIFAHEINGFGYEIEDDYIDIIEIDAASNRGIDNIRELREKVLIAPSLGKYKVYIIDEVHMLTREAFNALLKTLEEPPQHAIFIMATTNPEKVLTTITSRSQTFAFKLADPDTMTKYLQKIAKAEQITITDDALKIITRRGGGSFRDSLSLLDQISTLTDDEITPDIINRALGLPQDEMLRDLLNDYQTQDIAAINQHLREIFQYGSKPDVLVDELIKLILADPQPALLPLLGKLTTVTEPFAEAKLLLALVNSANGGGWHNVSSQKQQRYSTSQKKSSPRNMSESPESNSQPSRTEDSTVRAAGPTDVVNLTTADGDRSEGKNSFDSTANSFTQSTFDWPTFIESFHSDHPAIHSQLLKADYELDGNTLKIYHPSKIGRNILGKDNNLRLLNSQLSDLTAEILDPADRPATKDSTLDQISAIMGGVQEVKHGGESPF